MTWNVRDGICSSNDKSEGANNWCALARVVAAMRPDVLVIQEAGDNTGNGTGGGVDSVGALAAVVDLFVHGGNDPFKGGVPVTSYVQKYAPGFDLPHVFVGEETDNFNRNVILSRYPFKDLNGDGRSAISDIPFVTAHLYAPGGDGGVRGFLFAEIDLPDAEYGGDLVVGTAHLKAGSGTANHTQRVTAATNVAYYVDHLLNGAGGAIPDPFNTIADNPPATAVLDGQTPVILLGDFNEDEGKSTQKGPVAWLAQANLAGGSDGTDRDRSDGEWDSAVDLFSGFAGTVTSDKLDYVIVQDSIAGARRAWTFHSSSLPTAGVPAELAGFSGGAAAVSGIASDHRPVLMDVVLPEGGAPGAFSLLSPVNGQTKVEVEPVLEWEASAGAATYTVHMFADAALTQPVTAWFGLTQTSVQVGPGVLTTCEDYYWQVSAVNALGSTFGSPQPSMFETIRPADLNGDGVYDLFDFLVFTNLFNAGSPLADFTGDGVLDLFDFLAFTNAFNAGC